MDSHLESAWSLITDTPVFLHDTAYDIHYCYWHGVQLTRSYAILIISDEFLKIYPSKFATIHAYNEYHELCKRELVLNKLKKHYDYRTWYLKLKEDINNKVSFNILINAYTPQHAMRWLLQEYEVKTNNEFA